MSVDLRQPAGHEAPAVRLDDGQDQQKQHDHHREPDE
jgi:hypothetical protein